MISFNTLPASVKYQSVGNVYAFEVAEEYTDLELLLLGQNIRDNKSCGILIFPWSNGVVDTNFYCILYNTFQSKAYDIYSFAGGKNIQNLDPFSVSMIFKILGIEVLDRVYDVTSFDLFPDRIVRTKIFE